MDSPKLSWYALWSLARALRHPLLMLGKGLEPALRERIILRVSALNSCAVCSAVHGAVAECAVGLSHDDVMAARAAVVDARTGIALRYAELRTRDLEAQHPSEVEAFEKEFSPEERRAVCSLVDLFTFNNRFNNTWEAWLPGAGSRRQRLGID